MVAAPSPFPLPPSPITTFTVPLTHSPISFPIASFLCASPSSCPAAVLASGVVITGGSTLLAGMPEMAEEVLGMPVRRGMPRGIGGLVDVVKSPMYATAVGLVMYGAKQQANSPYFKIREDNVYRKVKNRMKEWLGEIF